jgi:hypothetical protein
VVQRSQKLLLTSKTLLYLNFFQLNSVFLSLFTTSVFLFYTLKIPPKHKTNKYVPLKYFGRSVYYFSFFAWHSSGIQKLKRKYLSIYSSTKILTLSKAYHYSLCHLRGLKTLLLLIFLQWLHSSYILYTKFLYDLSKIMIQQKFISNRYVPAKYLHDSFRKTYFSKKHLNKSPSTFIALIFSKSTLRPALQNTANKNVLCIFYHAQVFPKILPLKRAHNIETPSKSNQNISFKKPVTDFHRYNSLIMPPKHIFPQLHFISYHRRKPLVTKIECNIHKLLLSRCCYKSLTRSPQAADHQLSFAQNQLQNQHTTTVLHPTM